MESIFAAISNLYRWMNSPETVAAFFNNRFYTILAVVLFNISQTSFIPEEDQGVAVMSVQLPEGANKKRTADFIDKIREVLKTEPSIEGVSDVIGYNMIDGRGENVAMSFIVLRPWEERKDASQHSTAIVNRLRQKLSTFTGAEIQLFEMPAIQGLGNTNGLDIRLESRLVTRIRLNPYSLAQPQDTL